MEWLPFALSGVAITSLVFLASLASLVFRPGRELAILPLSRRFVGKGVLCSPTRFLVVAGLPYAYDDVIHHDGCTYMRRCAHEELGLLRREVRRIARLPQRGRVCSTT